MKHLVIILSCLLFSLSSCKNETSQQENLEDLKPMASEQSYDQPFRPQFHFSPPEKWMNDPNGMVFHQGIYHLFYQYYPDDIVWGPMHWGHATSTDLVRWENKPIALYPDEHGLIFSGSAVVDKNNTSGFGTQENPPLVAIYTYHLMEGEKAGRLDFQTQGLAYSLDNGDTWVKYKNNPIIGNTGIKDFRDPKVMWDTANERWVMTLVAGDHAKFYTSSNLIDWNLSGEFGKNTGAHGGVWECPDLFKLPVGNSGEEKWVLLISINPGAPNGGSGTQYFVGEFDGNTFTTKQKDIKWLDYGGDNYAGVTYANAPNDEKIFIGWMSNWNYARDTPTKVWRSAMTLPRKLGLQKDKSGEYYVTNFPIAALDLLEMKENEVNAPDPTQGYQWEDYTFNGHKISFDLVAGNEVSFTLSNDKDDQLLFKIEPSKQLLSLDKTKSGLVDFEARFADKVHTQPFTSTDKNHQVTVYIDWSSIEVFVDGGRYVFTEQIFPNTAYTSLSILGNQDKGISNIKINALSSIWR